MCVGRLEGRFADSSKCEMLHMTMSVVILINGAIGNFKLFLCICFYFKNFVQ